MTTPTPFPRGGTPVCANCGQRPGTVGVVLSTEGARRAAALCEVCAQEYVTAAAGGAPRPPPSPRRSPARRRSTSSAAT